jgi:hypothetical protein
LSVRRRGVREIHSSRRGFAVAIRADVQQFVGEQIEAELFEQFQNALAGFRVEQTDFRE